MKLRYPLSFFVVAVVLFITASIHLEHVQAHPEPEIPLTNIAIEVHPAGVLRMVGSQPHTDGYVLEVYTNLPRVAFGDTIFEIPAPGNYRFLIPRERNRVVTAL